MIIVLHISIALNLLALGLIYWLRKEQQMDNGMNAMMNDFNNYQVETDRKIVELEKQLEIKNKNQDKKMEKHLKELPFIIGKVVGQIELAQDNINRQM